MKHSLILIPDIHGRKFWKEAIPFVESGCSAVFLGDYCDPYDAEGITDKDAVDNMEEILLFARKNKDRVTMLLGNHDLSYFGTSLGLWNAYVTSACGTRGGATGVAAPLIFTANRNEKKDSMQTCYLSF